MATVARYDEDRREHDVRGLLWLIAGLILGAAALYAVAGPPRLPAELPTWDTIGTTLRGSYLPPEVVAYALTTAAWGVWLWMVATLVLRLVVAIADRLTHGAAWVHALRAVSDRVTLPVVRKLVDGAVVAFLVVNLVARSPAVAAAAPLTSTAAVSVAVGSERAADQTPLPASDQDGDQQTVEYTVQPGDSLWALAERFYGSGERWPELFAANRHRPQPDGRRLEDERRIYPGWILRVPVPNRVVEQVDGALHYVVRPGDTLRGIAGRLLGDEARWPEIFELNRGTASLPDGRVLTDPDLIWPDLRLRLPLPAHADAPRPALAAEAPAAPAAPSAPAASPSPTVPPEPTPAPASPTPVPTVPAPKAVASEPAVAPTPAVVAEPVSTAQDGVPSPFVLGAAGVAVAAAGSAVFLARRRVRRSLREPPVPPPPEPSPPPGDDFAEADPARVLAHRLHGGEVEPVVLVAEQARRFLDEQGLPDASVVLAYQGRNAATLVLDAPLLDQARLRELAAPFGARLGGRGQAAVTDGRDVLWRVSGLKAASLLAPPIDRGAVLPPLLALGLAPYDETLYVDWHALGHVLVAGLPGGGGEVVLASVVASLAARYRPDELRLWTIASRQTLAVELADLPHQARRFVAPDDDAVVQAVLQTLRAEVAERRRATAEAEGQGWRPSADQPEHVLVVAELGQLKDDGTTLELLGTDGPWVGVRVIAATTQAQALGDDVLTHFGTRLVLQTLDDDESVHLLGRPEAADLGPGELFVRVDGQAPVRVRGFRVSEEHLAALVRLMREAYPDPHRTQGPAFTVANAPEDEAPADDDALPSLTSSGDRADGPADALAPSLPASSSEHVFRVPEPPRHPAPVSPLASAMPVEDEHAPEPPSDEDLARAALPADEEEAAATEAEAAAGGDQTSEVAVALASPPPATSEHARSLNGHPGTAADGGVVEVLAMPAVADATSGEGSLLQVCCLGGFVVRSGERELTPTGEEGASYKAWEILAFLAAQPGGAAPKEKLLDAVWPEVDEERAANRLRSEMNRLRGILARQVPEFRPDLVRCDRDGTCRLDTTAVWSDAHRFWALCSAARSLPPGEAKPALEQALALYRGDLLSSRATRFYDWVEERDDSGVSLRERYRDQYCWVAQRLARLYRREGRLERAVALYKSLLKAEPTLEDIVRELYRCYSELGDLNALIREERHLRQALREAYYDPNDPEDAPDRYQPEVETVELFHRIRRELEERAGGPGVGRAAREG